jgi:ATP-dependent RNA helicase DeaD
LGLGEPLLEALGAMGWTHPSEIQSKMIPQALAGRDILGQARTGTGKTAAFTLPILNQLEEAPCVRCLILTPTRELSIQVAGDVKAYSRFTKHQVLATYGGTRVRGQAEQLKKNPAIVVGTPGRVMDLMNRGILKFDGLKFAVLDEVDRLLDIGFRDDIRKILGAVRHPHQTIFVSATIDDEINRLARQYMHDPVEVFCAPDKLTVDEVNQAYISVQPHDKRRLLVHLIKRENPGLAIVFTRTKRQTTHVAHALKEAGVNAKEIHGDLYQRKRDSIMKSFRGGSLHVLVATDLASRGLDIDDITHIINYDIPEDAEAYVHRVGRTARMGKDGRAITFVVPDQGDELTRIEKLINRMVPEEKVEGFTHSPPPEQQHAGAAPKPAEAAPPAEAEDADRPNRPLGGRFKSTRRKRLRR